MLQAECSNPSAAVSHVKVEHCNLVTYGIRFRTIKTLDRRNYERVKFLLLLCRSGDSVVEVILSFRNLRSMVKYRRPTCSLSQPCCRLLLLLSNAVDPKFQ